MAKATELREMSDEQVRLTWREAAEQLFRLRLQAQTERLDVPSELRKQRRTIARCQTILNQRKHAAAAAAPATAATTTAATTTAAPAATK
jgi:large subunit ribosomal protein L29